MKQKRIISFLISIIMILSLLPVFPTNVYAVSGNFDKPLTFIQVGRVTTLAKEYNSYYLITETFATDGSYVESVVKRELTEAQYQSELAKNAHNILLNKEITASIDGNFINEGGGRTYFVLSLKNDKGVLSNNSFIANITTMYDEYNKYLSLKNELPTPHSYLLKDNNRYFRCNENNVTGMITMTPLDQSNFELLKEDMTNNNISYLREINYYKDASARAHYSDIIYDENNNEFIALMKESIEIDKTIQDIMNGETYNDVSAPIEGEAANAFDQNRYDESYSSWEDDYNVGYQAEWEDPSFLGELELVEWEDPFWKNEDIDVGGVVTNNDGYTDDRGNFIKTDAEGNVIPSIPGKFDSSGNFMPDGVDGYYDPDGIFHPLFDKIDGITTGSDGSITVGEIGYLDKYGIWHSKDKLFDTIYLYNSKKVLPNGILLNEKNEYEALLTTDVWGNFYYNNYIIYKNGYMLNKDDYSLIKTDGNVLTHQLTDYGNYLYSDGSIILRDTLAMGTKTGDITVKLNNDSVVFETGAINYSNGVSYDNGIVILPNSEMINATFIDGKIDLGSFGIIYSNGHYAEYNEYGDLITDNDCVILTPEITFLENGYLLNSNGFILSTYKDNNLNVVSINGNVINRQLKLGIYDNQGNFIPGGIPENGYYYDRLGNKINVDGSVEKEDKIGYYNEDLEFVEGIIPYVGFYYTCDGNIVNSNGFVESKDNVNGYYDENNNFYMNNGKTYYDEDGVLYKVDKVRDYYINNNGNVVVNKYSDFVYNMDGSISILGASGNYVGDGLFKVKGNIGYYDEYGRFIISNQNTYLANNGFYDANQKWHNKNEIYLDSAGNLRLLRNPNIGLRIIDSEHIGFVYDEKLSFTKDGITEIDGQKGYYNSSGKFVVSNNSPYIGGFYLSSGQWIDKSYYTNEFGELDVNNGKFIFNGNYITPFGDIGYFDENSNFILGYKCQYEDFYYDDEGNKVSEENIYIDKLDIYKSSNRNIATNITGFQFNLKNDEKIVIDGYTYLYLGLFYNADGLIGYFDTEANFISGVKIYSEGFYLPDGTFIDNNEHIKYDKYIFFKNKNILKEDGENILLFMPDGYVFPLTKTEQQYLFSDNSILNADGEREFENNTENKFWIMNMYYIDSLDDTGYYNQNGTFFKNDGTFGYYDEEGNWYEGSTNVYMNGFYTKDKIWVGNDNKIPNKGYFNRYGIARNGDNPYEDGYFDEEGNWHINNRKIYIEINGNVHTLGEDAIGYYDYNNCLHLYGVEGWFDTDGTYIVDNTIMGYYTINGELKRGKNSSFEGFYDQEGRWYKFGSEGYYSADGKYVDSVNGEAIGYYNSVGEFNYGYNLYLTGFYGFNGEWSDKYKEPITMYYNVDGVEKLGSAPYYNGFYDMYGNWYIRGEKGYFDKHGTYYNIVTGDTGYYDAKGIYYEGTNPYQHGYYDLDRNLRLFGQEGHFDTNGTYIDINGEKWYFLNGGIKQKSQNPNVDGFYDMSGNWYNFGDTGYYNSEGNFYDFLIEISAYKVGSPDYILFEGIFDNTDFVSRKIQNTVQFSIFDNRYNNRYVDTGIRVAANAMISYDKAKDILHNISIYNSGNFIEDNDSCILIFDGNIISLKNTGKISIRELKNMFLDCDIEIIVARTRMGSRFTMTDFIESGNPIDIYMNNKKVALKKPLIVYDGLPYMSVEDLQQISIYSIRLEEDEDGKNSNLIFELKDYSVLENGGDKIYPIKIEYVANEMISKETYLNGDVIYEEDEGIGSEGKIQGDKYKTTRTIYCRLIKLNEDDLYYTPYITIWNLGVYTGKDVQLDTLKYRIVINDKGDDTPVVDLY